MCCSIVCVWRDYRSVNIISSFKKVKGGITMENIEEEKSNEIGKSRHNKDDDGPTYASISAEHKAKKRLQYTIEKRLDHAFITN